MGRRILIIDDEESLLFAFKSYFENEGYQVVCAREREEAEALLVHDNFDIIIIDLGLTGVHGKEGFELIKTAKKYSPVASVLLMTANATKRIEEESYRLGAKAFLQKPMALKEIADVVSQL